VGVGRMSSLQAKIRSLLTSTLLGMVLLLGRFLNLRGKLQTLYYIIIHTINILYINNKAKKIHKIQTIKKIYKISKRKQCMYENRQIITHSHTYT
jgi:hypothetical protein